MLGVEKSAQLLKSQQPKPTFQQTCGWHVSLPQLTCKLATTSMQAWTNGQNVLKNWHQSLKFWHMHVDL